MNQFDSAEARRRAYGKQKYSRESLARMAEECIKRANDSPQQYIELVQRLARQFNMTNERVQMEILMLIP